MSMQQQQRPSLTVVQHNMQAKPPTVSPPPLRCFPPSLGNSLFRQGKECGATERWRIGLEDLKKELLG